MSDYPGWIPAEAKLIILGEGGVGKTSLVRRLAGEPFTYMTPATRGMDVTKIVFATEGSTAVTINAWELGCQALLHALFHLFRSRDPLFLIVINSEFDSSHALYSVSRWLAAIRLWWTDAQCRCIVTRADHSSPNESSMQSICAGFPGISSVMAVSSLTGEGIPSLRKILINDVTRRPLSVVELPSGYKEVIDSLESSHPDFMEAREFRAICQACGVINPADQDLVLQLLGDLGRFLVLKTNCASDSRSESALFNPSWVGAVASTICRKAWETSIPGVLSQSEIYSAIGDEYATQPAAMDLLLGALSEAGVCVPAQSRSAAWVFPTALSWTPIEMDQVKQFDYSEARLAFDYSEFTPGMRALIVARFVKFADSVRSLSQSTITFGCAGATVAMLANVHSSVLSFAINGSKTERQAATTFIRSEMSAFHAMFDNVTVTRGILVEGTFLSLESLLKMSAKGASVYSVIDGSPTLASDLVLEFFGSADLPVSGDNAHLHGFTSFGVRTDANGWDAFASYNRSDVAEVQRVVNYLSSKGVRVWLDTNQLRPGHVWLDELESVLRRCGSFLVFLGPAGLGRWQEAEARLCVREFVHRAASVIPVLLPGVIDTSKVPLFLSMFTWMRCREFEHDSSLDALVEVVRGARMESNDVIKH